MAKNYVVSSFLWGVVAKILDAGIKFISVPFLLSYFGKQEFGLIALATSVNAYLQLLDMGVNTGAIKFFSEWIGEKKFEVLDSVARTSILFYGVVGAINSLVLVLIAHWGLHSFSVTAQQESVLRGMLLTLSLFSTINWISSVFSQLITANENLAFIEKINIGRSLLSLAVIGLTIHQRLSVELYFLGFTIVNSVAICPLFLKAKNDGLIKHFIPKKDWDNFKKIFRYSLAIIAMGIFQMSATKLRPIVLGLFSYKGIEIITDYRVLETITIFIISIGGMFISIFIPKSAKLLMENDREKLRSFAYQATSYTSIVCCFLCVPFVTCGTEILSLYVGKQYSYLNNWLTLWVLTILFSLHNSPVASLVLATGKTKMLVYSSGLACIISLILNAVLVNSLGVGSAVVGYCIYIVIQMSFYYFYFNRKILGLDSFLIFKAFIIPAALSLFSAFLVNLLPFSYDSVVFQVIAKLTFWTLLFITGLFASRIVTFRDILTLRGYKNS